MTQRPPSGGTPLQPSPTGPGAPQPATPSATPLASGSRAEQPQAALSQHAAPPAAPSHQPTRGERHLLWRAKKDSKPIVALWLTPTADGCDLSSDVYPVKSLRVDPIEAGPYRFQRAADAQAFAQEAARALMHLGCEIVEDERQQGDTPGSLGTNLRVAQPPARL